MFCGSASLVEVKMSFRCGSWDEAGVPFGNASAEADFGALPNRLTEGGPAPGPISKDDGKRSTSLNIVTVRSSLPGVI